MSNKEYEYKFDTVKPLDDRVYDDRVMHYYKIIQTSLHVH